MKLTLFRRGVLIRNLLIFITLALIHFQVLDWRIQGKIATQWQPFLDLMLANKILLLTYGLTFISIFKAWRVSRFFLALFVSIIAFKGITFFFIKFDKMILALDFAFIVVGFLFCLFWWMKLNESIYRPGFTRNDIGKRSEYDFPVIITLGTDEIYRGYLTNWDEVGCFVNIENSVEHLVGEVLVSIEKFGRKFTHRGRVMTGYAEGVGIKFNDQQEKESDHDWFDFYDIINDRGYYPRTMRA